MPSEQQLFANFFEQVIAADDLGFGTAWLAESHLSTEVQKENPFPVVDREFPKSIKLINEFELLLSSARNVER